jgi:hypothetical protein
LKTQDGALFVCGDNQFHQLGVATQPVVSQPTRLAGPAAAGPLLALGGDHLAFSSDACTFRIVGPTDDAIAAATGAAMPSACGRAAASATPVASVVHPCDRR